MLATLVLNGEGSRLIGRYSDNLELQAFLENVPSYMVRMCLNKTSVKHNRKFVTLVVISESIESIRERSKTSLSY